MADVKINALTFTISAVNQYIVGDAAGDAVGRIVAHLVGDTFTGEIVIKGRARGTSKDFVAIPYVKRHLNGSVADGTTVSVAITGDSIIDIDATGLDIAFDATTVDAGTVSVTWGPYRG